MTVCVWGGYRHIDGAVANAPVSLSSPSAAHTFHPLDRRFGAHTFHPRSGFRQGTSTRASLALQVRSLILLLSVFDSAGPSACGLRKTGA